MLPINFHQASNNQSIARTVASNQSLIEEWTAWAGAAHLKPEEQRNEALSRLKSQVRFNKRKLDLSRLNLSELPNNLPDPLKKLNLRGNQLIDLPKLPSTLTELDVGYNKLRSLPNNLPPSLEILNADNNQLTDLPELPASLEKLNISSNRFTQLMGVHLPLDLHELNICENKLTELPALPLSLKCLYASYNDIKRLPQVWPHLLVDIDLSDNKKLGSLPKDLPPHLERLHVNRCGLGSLPRTLPHSLKILAAIGNKLTILPTTWPASLEQLELQSNSILPSEPIPEYLPPSLKYINLSYQQN